MRGKTMLYIDQYGGRYWARTVADLRSQIGMGGSKVSKMYADKISGVSVHIGYVVGDHWLTAYIPYEGKA